jgi:hypothetical protein
VAASYSTEKKLYAIRYKQGGRTVYSIAMTPAQIAATIKKPDHTKASEGNRKIRLPHAKAFARYVIDNEGWVSPGIILRAPSIFTFAKDDAIADMQFGVVSYPARSEGDIHILDGQHRILGFHEALEMVDEMLDKTRMQLATARRVGEGEKEARQEIMRLDGVRDRLYNERISVEIQVTDDMQTSRQMFFDIAENQLGITASVKARFDNRKVLNRALPDILDHPLLLERVDLEANQLSRSNPNFLTASHVAEISRVVMLGLEGRFGRRTEKELHEAEIAKSVRSFLDMATHSFPVLRSLQAGQIDALHLRAHSMLASAVFIRVLAGVYHDLTTKRGWAAGDVEAFFAALAQHTNAPAHANSIWKKHAPSEVFVEGSWSPSGRRQDTKALFQAVTLWAVLGEKFVHEAPQPAPEPEEPTDEERIAMLDPAAGTGAMLTGAAAEFALETDAIAKQSKARGKARSTAKKTK